MKKVSKKDADRLRLLDVLPGGDKPLKGGLIPRCVLDIQHGGDHYKNLGEYQPYIVFRHWMTPDELRGFAKGSAMKYIQRERLKGGDEDLRKAMHHIQLYLEVTGAKNESS